MALNQLFASYKNFNISFAEIGILQLWPIVPFWRTSFITYSAVLSLGWLALKKAHLSNVVSLHRYRGSLLRHLYCYSSKWTQLFCWFKPQGNSM